MRRTSPLFFFQAEDGIRDATVTGVQTCALPISRATGGPLRTARRRAGGGAGRRQWSPRRARRRRQAEDRPAGRAGAGRAAAPVPPCGWRAGAAGGVVERGRPAPRQRRLGAHLYEGQPAPRPARARWLPRDTPHAAALVRAEMVFGRQSVLRGPRWPPGFAGRFAR